MKKIEFRFCIIKFHFFLQLGEILRDGEASDNGWIGFLIYLSECVDVEDDELSNDDELENCGGTQVLWGATASACCFLF